MCRLCPAALALGFPLVAQREPGRDHMPTIAASAMAPLMTAG